MMRFTVLILTTLIFTGCLRTRAELRGDDSGDKTLEQQTQSQQAAAKADNAPAPQPDRVSILSERMDSVESQIARLNADKPQAAPVDNSAQTKAMIDQRFLAYEQELKKIEGEIQSLSVEVEQLKNPPSKAEPATKGHSTFDQAEGLFKEKKWKQAIVMYQKYRDHNSKGKYYTESTYKIGVCFEELHMKDEAKAFFQEVITKHPKTKEAKKAAYRMKTLK